MYSAREVDLRGLIITNEWVVTIVNAITAVQREKKSHGKSAPVTERLICADTSLNDSAFHPIHRLKYLTVVDISRYLIPSMDWYRVCYMCVSLGAMR